MFKKYDVVQNIMYPNTILVVGHPMSDCFIELGDYKTGDFDILCDSFSNEDYKKIGVFTPNKEPVKVGDTVKYPTGNKSYCVLSIHGKEAWIKNGNNSYIAKLDSLEVIN